MRIDSEQRRAATLRAANVGYIGRCTMVLISMIFSQYLVEVATLDINLVMLAARCDLLRLSKRQDTGVLW
jgi:hypothetical protein